MTTYSHDLIVIGAGMAGINAAAKAADAGKRVVLIERDRVGGSCPIRGCIPTKALIRSAEVAHTARRAAEFGIRIPTVEVDFLAVMTRVRDIIDRGERGTREYVRSLDGVELVEGEARFRGPEQVAVADRTFSAPRIVVATGASPAVPPIPGLDDVAYLTSDTLLELTQLPQSLVVIGGGPIALELGQAMSRLGSHVTIIEVLPRLMPSEEPEVVDLLSAYLVAEGIEILTGVEIHEVTAGPAVVLTHNGTARTLRADAILVATGRQPETAALDLGAAGVETGKSGVTITNRLETSQPSVYAAGDVAGPPFGGFTPVSRRTGGEAAENALDLSPHDVAPDEGPWAVFTDPEFSMVGMTEAEAREAGHDVVVGTSEFTGGKARAWGEERGTVKVVVERGTRRILGARILAYHAADLINEIAVAMRAGDGTVHPILDAMHVHPTLAERVTGAVGSAKG